MHDVSCAKKKKVFLDFLKGEHFCLESIVIFPCWATIMSYYSTAVHIYQRKLGNIKSVIYLCLILWQMCVIYIYIYNSRYINRQFLLKMISAANPVKAVAKGNIL